MQSQKIKNILRRLFSKGNKRKYKFTELENSDFYAFVINNVKQLKMDFKSVTSQMGGTQMTFMLEPKTVNFAIPEMEVYKYSEVKKRMLFYPDYIVRMKDGTDWIVETKGGEISGHSKNIDCRLETNLIHLNNMLKNTNCIGGLYEISMRNCLLTIQSLFMIGQMVTGLICRRSFNKVKNAVKVEARSLNYFLE